VSISSTFYEQLLCPNPFAKKLQALNVSTCKLRKKLLYEKAAHKMLVKVTPGPNVIKLFTVVIYRHSMVILSLCVIKQYYRGNYCGMAVNYHGIYLTNVIKHNLT
jgi:hypothetical protein